MYFGDNSNDSRFKHLQAGINHLIKFDDDDGEISNTYKELLNNIKINDVCFNIFDDEESIVGQSNINVILDKNFNGEEHMIVILLP